MASTGALSDLVHKASFHFTKARPLLPMYIHLILSALFPIYTGAHASLSRPASAAKPDKKAKKTIDAEDEDEDEDKVQKMEGLSNKDAIVLPITAGLVLAGLYFLIMKYGADIINLVMGYYFSGVGVFSVAKLVNDAANLFIGFLFPTYFRYKSSLSDKGCLMKVDSRERKVVRQDDNGEIEEASGLPVPNPLAEIRLPQWLTEGTWALRHELKQKYTVKGYVHTVVDLCMNVTIITLLSSLMGVGTIIYVNTISKPWFLTNFQGFAVSYSALQLLSPTTFVTGSLILGALFFYDIWAVFFTPLMVAVAKNLDQPIKLVFPRPDDLSATPGQPPVKSFSMLGLGDIVVPGIMIGLALRFDLYMFYLKKQKKGTKTSIGSSTGEATTEEVVQKAQYVSVTGRWGDKFWTFGLPSESLPAQLRSAFPKPYFFAAMIGYVSGMVTTLGVMSVFHHAQPALLYLVPGVLLSLWGTALVRGEIKDMWDFSEAVTAEQIEDDQDNKDDESKKDGAEKSPKGLFERMWHEIWHGEEKKEDQKKSDDRSSGSESSKSKKDGKKAAKSEDKDESKSNVLFSFSVSRHEPKSSSSSKTEQAKQSENADLKNTHSSATSESSEDVVVISSGDLDGTQEMNTAPRYRTRSTKSGDVERRT